MFGLSTKQVVLTKSETVAQLIKWAASGVDISVPDFGLELLTVHKLAFLINDTNKMLCKAKSLNSLGDCTILVKCDSTRYEMTKAEAIELLTGWQQLGIDVNINLASKYTAEWLGDYITKLNWRLFQSNNPHSLGDWDFVIVDRMTEHTVRSTKVLTRTEALTLIEDWRTAYVVVSNLGGNLMEYRGNGELAEIINLTNNRLWEEKHPKSIGNFEIDVHDDADSADCNEWPLLRLTRPEAIEQIEAWSGRHGITVPYGDCSRFELSTNKNLASVIMQVNNELLKENRLRSLGKCRVVVNDTDDHSEAAVTFVQSVDDVIISEGIVGRFTNEDLNETKLHIACEAGPAIGSKFISHDGFEVEVICTSFSTSDNTQMVTYFRDEKRFTCTLAEFTGEIKVPRFRAKDKCHRA